MTDTLTLSGSISVEAAVLAPPGVPAVQAVLEEILSLQNRVVTRYELTTDALQAVAFGPLASAHVVQLKVTAGSHVVATLTSADGSAQTIPVGGLLVLVSRTVPVTSLALTRDAGVATTVEVFLGQKA